MTRTCHVCKNEQNRPVNTRRLLCPRDCLDLLLLSHAGLGHALSEVKHEDPVLTLLSRVDSVCTPNRDLRCANLARLATDRAPSVSRHQEPPHVCSAYPASPNSQGQKLVHCAFVLDGSSSSSSSGSSSSFKSKMVCTFTSLIKFGNISCARPVEEPVLDHRITVFLKKRRLCLPRRTTAPTGTLNVSNMVPVMRS